MRLINHTLLILTAILFVSVSLWAILFYFQIFKQVKETVDEGLSDYKIVIIDKLNENGVVDQKDNFLDDNYIVKEISENYALQVRDIYKDTLIYSKLKDLKYQVRMLTTAFSAENGNYYEIKVISHELNRGELIKKILISLSWLFSFLFISTMLINLLALRNTWKPFYSVLKYLDDFRLDRVKLRKPPETRIKEFNLLNESVQKLLRTNIDIYNSQKQFIENASHELQTPLAIGVNKLELLAGDENLTADHQKKIGEVIDAFKRISEINRSLLLLSKIENKQFIEVEPCNFDVLLSEILDKFSDYLKFKKIEVKYQVEEAWIFEINKDLADILVSNLLKNALIHNRKGGEILVKLHASGFIIENTSDAPALNKEQLFKRFNKNSKSKNSTGLGLAIAKAIADVSGLELTYTYKERHCFNVGIL